MIDEHSGYDIRMIPPTGKNEKYLYVMENEVNKFKIGITDNINKRYLSLCGSNGQGNKIIRIYCSPATCMYVTLERIMDQIFEQYRIPGTEWFYDEDGILRFEDIVTEVEKLFSDPSYSKLNDLRRNFPYKM